MRKLIFLDCDGVITTYKSGWKFDPEKLELLKHILDETDADIVVSSSWRYSTVKETLEKSFKDFPFKDRIVDVTPRLNLPGKKGDWTFFMPERGLEIDAYLNKLTGHDFHHEKYVKYVILDDDPDFLWVQRNNFIRTDSYLGMSEEDVEKAIKILNKDEV